MSSPTSVDNVSVTVVVDENEDKSIVLDDVTPVIEEKVDDIAKQQAELIEAQKEINRDLRRFLRQNGNGD